MGKIKVLVGNRTQLLAVSPHYDNVAVYSVTPFTIPEFARAQRVLTNNFQAAIERAARVQVRTYHEWLRRLARGELNLRGAEMALLPKENLQEVVIDDESDRTARYSEAS